MRSIATGLMAAGALALAPCTEAFYLPGVAPREYKAGETVQLKVNKMTSSRTQLPYDFYDLPFCRPEKGIIDSAENLGEILTGNVIQNSPYEIKMHEEVSCKVVCQKKFTDKEAEMFAEKINEQYLVNMIMDNLPAAFMKASDDGKKNLAFYSHGYPIGGLVISPDGLPSYNYINNHIAITVRFHIPKSIEQQADLSDSIEGLPARIVGLFIEPMSYNHRYDAKKNTVNRCPTRSDPNSVSKFGQKINKGTEVIFTYSVTWEPSSIKWASRWDNYLNSKTVSDEVHWFSIINSLLIVVFLTGMVAMILMRTLHKDLTRYNRVPTEDEKAEEREETGWKLVHGDVFRPPAYPMLFAVTIGTGSQVLSMALVTIMFAAMGFLSPANRGSLMIALLLLFMFLGVLAGYFSARTYKMFNGEQWQRCTLFTATLYPSIIAGSLFVLNLVVWAEGSSSAIPFGSMLAVLALWFCISVPLTFLGAFYGYKRDVDKQPVQTQDIPRAIPEQPWYMSPYLTSLVGGILPFGAVFVELFFILSSIWLDQYYYVFGFLLLVFLILMITCAEITIVLCYFQLCGEDYNWWWRSLFTSGSSALYLFMYSIFYFSGRLKMDLFVTAVLYFGYMFILSVLFFLATAVIGYFACYWFNVKIFGSIKVD